MSSHGKLAVTPAAALDIGRLRRDFPILDLKINGKSLIFLDNAASSQMPRQIPSASSGEGRPPSRSRSSPIWTASRS